MKPLARPMHAGRMLFALARRWDWMHNRLVTELDIDGLREDLVIVSRAGYATVVEIKISRADWEKDRDKRRWPSEHIARFFYAVPRQVLVRGIPAHVPEHCGILSVRDGGHWAGYDTVREERCARRMPAAKLSDAQLKKIDEAFYYRYWRERMDAERLRLFDRPAVAALHAA